MKESKHYYVTANQSTDFNNAGLQTAQKTVILKAPYVKANLYVNICLYILI